MGVRLSVQCFPMIVSTKNIMRFLVCVEKPCGRKIEVAEPVSTASYFFFDSSDFIFTKVQGNQACNTEVMAYKPNRKHNKNPPRLPISKLALARWA